MCAIKRLSCCLSGSWLACAIAYGRGFDSMKMAYYSSSDTILNCKRHNDWERTKQIRNGQRHRKRETRDESKVMSTVKWNEDDLLMFRILITFRIERDTTNKKKRSFRIRIHVYRMESSAPSLSFMVLNEYPTFFSLPMHWGTKLKNTESVSLSNAVVSLSSTGSKPMVHDATATAAFTYAYIDIYIVSHVTLSRRKMYTDSKWKISVTMTMLSRAKHRLVEKPTNMGNFLFLFKTKYHFDVEKFKGLHLKCRRKTSVLGYCVLMSNSKIDSWKTFDFILFLFFIPINWYTSICSTLFRCEEEFLHQQALKITEFIFIYVFVSIR